MTACFRQFKLSAGFVMLVGFAASALSGEPKKNAYLVPAEAGPDFAVQGEYAGSTGDNAKFGAQVIALGEAKFDAVVYPGGLPGAGWDGKTKIRLSGQTKDGVTELSGSEFSAKIKGETFAGVANGNVTYNANKLLRKSPMLGAKPPKGAVVLFDGTSVDGWQNGMLVEDPVTGEKLLNNGTWNERTPRDFTLHLEFRSPFMPLERGQGRGNSGMYVSGQYECQILDSFGLEGENNECGGIYSIAKPSVNMCFPPLSWQTYDVEFRGARFDNNGQKTSNAVVTIRHNGVVIHDNLEFPKATPGGRGLDEKPAPLFLQDHGNPVHFRNIWVVEK